MQPAKAKRGQLNTRDGRREKYEQLTWSSGDNELSVFAADKTASVELISGKGKAAQSAMEKAQVKRGAKDL